VTKKLLTKDRKVLIIVNQYFKEKSEVPNIG